MCNNRYGWSVNRGFYGKSEMPIGMKTQPTDLELRIRKEAMDAVAEMMDKLHSPEVSITRMRTLAYTINDRLNLLWGSDDPR